jgi:hypothetical protein
MTAFRIPFVKSAVERQVTDVLLTYQRWQAIGRNGRASVSDWTTYAEASKSKLVFKCPKFGFCEMLLLPNWVKLLIAALWVPNSKIRAWSLPREMHCDFGTRDIISIF